MDKRIYFSGGASGFQCESMSIDMVIAATMYQHVTRTSVDRFDGPIWDGNYQIGNWLAECLNRSNGVYKLTWTVNGRVSSWLVTNTTLSKLT
ncbi:MAG: hypothetical protein E6R03_18295 [Hyphomicrobiaceae bacterium]|nr:MAG: hypothetical protein E6R03_18295 [Hyphomicrobiaceae bacterium]